MRKRNKPSRFVNETFAHFKALGVLRKTIHLLPDEARAPMREVLNLVRQAEVRSRKEFLKAYADFQEGKARNEAS